MLHPSNETGVVEQRKSGNVKHPAAKPSLLGQQGQYTLRGWRDARGKARQFSCTVVKFSSEMIRLAAPVTGTVGEWVYADFGHFGNFEGPITETAEDQFTMWIVATAERRQKIARKIAWAKDKNSVNKRRHERMLPSNPHSIIRFVDGRVAACQVVDYSLSGVAVSAEMSPKVGTIVKIGEILGQVLRHTAEGFTVEFLLVQNARTIENLFLKE